MEFCKLQVGCLIVIAYIAFIYYRESFRSQKKSYKPSMFDGMLAIAFVCVVFDGLTAYTVNHLESVNPVLNAVLHFIFLISLDTVVFYQFVYMLKITEGIPAKKTLRLFMATPFILNVLVVILNMGSLKYNKGNISNYSMGISVYACFAVVGIYVLLTLIIFIKRWDYIESHKKSSILTYLLMVVGIAGIQILNPDLLLTSIAVTVMLMGAYLNQEDPALKELSRYHEEMVSGFAVLIEGKDGSTGGHVKRTTAYVKLIIKELKKRGYYKNVLTKDYSKNMAMAAPMHDIGKISVPDVILQKPGKLTDEEFAEIKKHTVNGGKIIKSTFGDLGNDQYLEMAYNVALHHHEKWNGKGYPMGLKETEIPLCARIMAVADVFDAVSEKRCYRDAMPLDKCFEIIKNGSGQDFDPTIADVFVEIREKVEKVHSSIN